MVNAAWIYKLNSTIYRCLSLFTAILAGAVDVDIPRGEIRIKDQSAYHTLAVLGEITIELGQADHIRVCRFTAIVNRKRIIPTVKSTISGAYFLISFPIAIII